MRLHQMSYKNFTLLMVLAALVLSIAVGTVMASYIKKIALTDLAKIDAKKSSEFVFESLYSGMEKGWNKQDMLRIIERLNKVEPGMIIKAHRSELVSSQFGDIPEDVYARNNDPLIKKAMSGEEVFVLQDKSVRYIYPIKAKAECLTCHKTVNVGDVNGVIDISYPTSKLRVSLSFVLNSFIVYFIVFLVLSFGFFYFNLNRFLVKPLNNLVYVIKSIISKRDLDERVHLDTQIAEVNNLSMSFNKLLDYLKRYNEQQVEQYFSDSLTGLPNRLRLIDDISTVGEASLVIFNIDAFKEINDFYGVKVGDFILVELAGRLKQYIAKHQGLYRIAGDEYAVLMLEREENDALELFMRNLVSFIKKEIFMYDDYEVTIDVTAGAASGAGSLIEHADMALKLAKKNKKSCLVFDPGFGLSKQYEKNIVWSKKIKEAIDSDRIVPFFQPIVDNQTQLTTKYECLVRLLDDSGKPVSPYLFLDVAKRAKIYTYITKIVIEKAFETFHDTQFEFSINLSVEDIQEQVLCEYIYKKLEQFSEPQNVVFELTESEGIESFEEVVQFIANVKSLGAKIAIDDFGTGYSNFAYLLKLDVDYLKIDATMVKTIDTDASSEAIVETIVDFCRKMNIKTIAEFVHNKEVFEKVKELGVDFSQGYYFGEPTKFI